MILTSQDTILFIVIYFCMYIYQKLYRMYHFITEDNYSFSDAYKASFAEEKSFGVRNNILAYAALAFATFGLLVCYKFSVQEITYSKFHTMIIVAVCALLAFMLIKLRR